LKITRKDKKTMKIIKNNQTIEMTYEDICHDLGIIPSIHFVEITNRGTISFTVGKPEEIRHLINTAEDKGYKLSQVLLRNRNKYR